ncbi:acyl-CoA thioesterase [Martelella sp. HB161492]|uniref:acyl-CoA thioesterase n=1 Tax=Martelella sp. HB161492 TaxID=2720726 RepID=UPI001591DB27|nr:acyl-CoA thioesterase [Martelella sp. HB161492]
MTISRSRFRQNLNPPHDISTVWLRVWPQDLDINFHVNNGRYLTLMDIGRMDLLFRSGLAQNMRRHGWIPVLTGLNARYRRSLGLFARFALETEIVGWTQHSLFMEHRIMTATGELAVSAFVRAVVLKPGDGKEKVTTEDFFAPLGRLPSSPALPEACLLLLSPAERATMAVAA